MTDKQIQEKSESDGRSIELDTGYYHVQVWGDPGDDMEDLTDTLENVADRALEDLQKLEDDGEGGHYQ